MPINIHKRGIHFVIDRDMACAKNIYHVETYYEIYYVLFVNVLQCNITKDEPVKNGKNMNDD